LEYTAVTEFEEQGITDIGIPLPPRYCNMRYNCTVKVTPTEGVCINPQVITSELLQYPDASNFIGTPIVKLKVRNPANMPESIKVTFLPQILTAGQIKISDYNQNYTLSKDDPEVQFKMPFVGATPRAQNRAIVFIHKISTVTAADPRVEIDVYVDLSDVRFVQSLAKDTYQTEPFRKIVKSELTITNFIAE
jgi:hypothetical protein